MDGWITRSGWVTFWQAALKILNRDFPGLKVITFLGIPEWTVCVCVAGVVLRPAEGVDAPVSQLEFRVEIINTRMHWNAEHWSLALEMWKEYHNHSAICVFTYFSNVFSCKNIFGNFPNVFFSRQFALFVFFLHSHCYKHTHWEDTYSTQVMVPKTVSLNLYKDGNNRLDV